MKWKVVVSKETVLLRWWESGPLKFRDHLSTEYRSILSADMSTYRWYISRYSVDMSALTRLIYINRHQSVNRCLQYTWSNLVSYKMKRLKFSPWRDNKVDILSFSPSSEQRAVTNTLKTGWRRANAQNPQLCYTVCSQWVFR